MFVEFIITELQSFFFDPYTEQEPGRNSIVKNVSIAQATSQHWRNYHIVVAKDVDIAFVIVLCQIFRYYVTEYRTEEVI